jgi:glycerol-3-phosphate dehydrogenase
MFRASIDIDGWLIAPRTTTGETMAQIRANSLEVAEGVATTPAAARLAQQLGLDCPIIAAVDRALAGTATPRELVAELLARDIGEELPPLTPSTPRSPLDIDL